MNPSRNAFNLTELLVVIGITGMLVGFVLPALCKAKAQARGAACKNNLRQLGLALTMYVGDFDRYPTYDDWVVTAMPWFRNQTLLPNVVDQRSVFRCPAHKPRLTEKTDRVFFDPLSYGYNSVGSDDHFGNRNLGLGASKARPIAAAQVRVPIEMIALGDSGTDTDWDLLMNPHQSPPSSDKHDLSTLNSWLPSRRHRGGANAVFCDGHVEYAAQKRWIEKSDRARQRWNNDNQPHPETW